MRVRCFCDGGARGNPGPAAAGAVVVGENGDTLAGCGRFLGTATNNAAEYQGVLLGLELARRAGADHVSLRLDSELIVKQLQGTYRVRHPDMRRWHARVEKELAGFAGWDVKHVPRGENRLADRLVNRALDRRNEVADAPDG